MAKLPQGELLDAFSLTRHDDELDNQTSVRLKNRFAEEFRAQLTIGIPTNDDEAGLRRLATQIRAKKVVVKLFLRHPLHAKLYLLNLPASHQSDRWILGKQQPYFRWARQTGRT